jgi:hypothetical protein
MSIALDVEVASYISHNYADRREQSSFINQVLKAYIDDRELTTVERIDVEVERIKTEARAKVNELLDKKQRLIENV